MYIIIEGNMDPVLKDDLDDALGYIDENDADPDYLLEVTPEHVQKLSYFPMLMDYRRELEVERTNRIMDRFQ